jgi:Fe-S oxidoreductase
VPLQTRLIRDTATIGKVASLTPALTNLALRNPANRVVMEKVVNIHRDKLMPTYHRETFPRWWSRHTPRVESLQPLKEGVETPTPTKVALFSTCLIDYNDPAVGIAAVQVLEHNGIEVVRPAATGLLRHAVPRRRRSRRRRQEDPRQRRGTSRRMSSRATRSSFRRRAAV